LPNPTSSATSSATRGMRKALATGSSW
jgi:hypothetical protein